MRVLVITTSYPLTPSSYSGVFIKRLIDALARIHDVRVLTPCVAETVPSIDKVVCYRYAPKRWQRLAHGGGGIPAALKETPWLYLLVPAFLVSALGYALRDAKAVDVIHSNWSVIGVIGGLAARLTSRAAVTTLRGSDVYRAQRSHVERVLLRLCIRLNSKIVTVSDTLRREVIALVPEAEPKTVVIGNGVDDRLFAIENNIDRRPLIVTTIGNLIEDKAVQFLIEALSTLPQVHLRVIGSGPTLANLRAQAEHFGISQRAEFCGAVAPDDISSRLADTDIYVSTSMHEGRSNALIEAMAAGRAIVASNIAGNSEVIEHGKSGLLFEAGNVPDLRDQLNTMIENPELRQSLGKNARATAVERGWRWTTAVERYTSVYTEAVAKMR